MRLLIATLVLAIATPVPATAQRGQQIFDFLLQGAQQEINRQQQREFERQQRQQLNRMHQEFVAHWHRCHDGDVMACDTALSYPHVNHTDRQALFGRRAAILAAQQEAAEREHRARIEAAERERQELARQRAEAAWQRQRAEQAERDKRDAETRLLVLRREQERQAQAALLWTWDVALYAMAGTLAAIAVLAWRSTALHDRLRWDWSVFVALFRRPRPTVAAQAEAPVEVAAPPVAPPPLPSAKANIQRDTPGAMAALELALAYIEEVRHADRPGLDDIAERKNQLNTLALAAKQLDLAAKRDPDAVLEGSSDDTHYRFTINELKAEALLLEGMTHQIYDLKRAIPALVKATQHNPQSAHTFFVLGLTHAANMSKAKAVAALEQAVKLDPKNITYRKELNRAQSLSGSEIAAYKATRAGEKVFDAGIKTANAGIMAWNIFAVIWNIITFPIRMVFGIFRLLRLHPFG